MYRVERKVCPRLLSMNSTPSIWWTLNFKVEIYSWRCILLITLFQKTIVLWSAKSDFMVLDAWMSILRDAFRIMLTVSLTIV